VTRALLAIGATLLGVACGGGSSPTLATPVPTPSPAAPTARYSVTFEAQWRAETHPTDIPSDPHFSRLIGGTHSARVRFWAPGAIASDGVERMAEEGRTSPLDLEIMAAISAAHAQHLIRGESIPLSPASTSVEFEISLEHPLVTLVSMVAPSPDWFVGVHDLSLVENGDWVREKVVMLYPYDAGSDSGVTFTSPDRDTQPREPIHSIETPPLALSGMVAPMGTFTFRRLGS